MSHYKKPAKLDADCAWVSIESVEGGTGESRKELGWCCEYVAATRFTFGQIAKEAAADWYRDTDQCSDCVVVVRIEDARGQVVLVRAHAEIKTVLRTIGTPETQTRVGSSIAAEKAARP